MRLRQGRGERDDPDNQIVLSGSVDVPRGESLEHVLIFNGDVRVDGRVHEWVVAFNGDVTIDGRVGGSVTAFNGRVVVTESGSVGGDVVSSDRPRIAERNSVAGDVDRVRRRFALGQLATIGRVVLWIAATVSSFLLGGFLLLVAPRVTEGAARAGRRSVGPAIGLGFAVVFGVPIVGILLSITIVALPLGIATLLAVALLYGVGYVIGGVFLGRLILKEPRNRLVSFLVGWGILRVAAIIPVVGFFALSAATIYGLGCLTVAAYHARQRAAPGERARAACARRRTGGRVGPRLAGSRGGFGILHGMPTAPGNRLRCPQCETEIIVVKGSDGEVSCCGAPMAKREG